MKEQLLTEIKEDLKGCENGFGPKSFGSHIFSCGGENGLCPICKAIQQAQKETLLMCAKNELEFLREIGRIEYTRECDIVCYPEEFYQRISQLQEVIKKLEEMK